MTDGRPSSVPGASTVARTAVAPMSRPMACPSRVEHAGLVEADLAMLHRDCSVASGQARWTRCGVGVGERRAGEDGEQRAGDHGRAERDRRLAARAPQRSAARPRRGHRGRRRRTRRPEGRVGQEAEGGADDAGELDVTENPCRRIDEHEREVEANSAAAPIAARTSGSTLPSDERRQRRAAGQHE